MKLSDADVAVLAKEMGICAAEIAKRKAFLEFDENDARLLRELHEHLLNEVQRRFVDDFYVHLLEFEETRRFIPNARSLERLKQTQSTYFDTLTAGNYGEEYVHDRLRVGVAHERIGLAPQWYIGSYNKYLTSLLPELWRLLRHDPQKFLDTYRALQKAVLFDMGLAIDTYIHADRRAILGLKKYAEDIIASLPAGLIVFDDSLRVRSVNRSFRELFGSGRREELSGLDMEAILPLPGLRQQAQGVLMSGTAVHGIDAKLGGKCLRLAIAGIHFAEEENDKKKKDCLLVVVEDVTEEHILRDEARAHEQRFHDLVQGLDAIVWEGEVIDGGLRFVFVSLRAEAILGYPVERWLNDPVFWKGCLHPDDIQAVDDFRDRILNRESDTLDGVPGWKVEYRMRAADGHVVWFHNLARRVADPSGVRLRGVMMDITARKEMESRLAHLASHDALTGLPNRNLLNDRLGQALVYATRHGRAAGVLFLDLDRFKTINDSLGHSVGDRLLKVVADRLLSCVREGDTVARIGGDEFVVLLDDMAQPQDVALIAQKVLASFVQPFRVDVQEAEGGVQEFFFTTSIGISLYPGDGEDAQALLKNADTAMYRAKKQGGNSYRFFTAEMDLRARKSLSLEHALHGALERQEVELHYQPQIDIVTKKVIGVEALLRWNRPGQGLMAPADFTPLLEEIGLIVPVGAWVLRTACAQYQTWRKAGLHVPRAAVNLSVRQLRHERFVDSVVEALADTGMEPGCLEFEVTESAVMQQLEASLEALRRVRALGVRLSMDDFGTGYSSLSHLKLLPVDTVKIDRSFIRDVPADENDSAIVRAVIALARTLGLDVIAEGVETKEQLEFLRTHGCNAMQGYLFSHPLPAEMLTRFLVDQRQHSL
ncbi:MAG: EAL domain-containing protein [Pseudomonadota bacterium]